MTLAYKMPELYFTYQQYYMFLHLFHSNSPDSTWESKIDRFKSIFDIFKRKIINIINLSVSQTQINS